MGRAHRPVVESPFGATQDGAQRVRLVMLHISFIFSAYSSRASYPLAVLPLSFLQSILYFCYAEDTRTCAPQRARAPWSRAAVSCVRSRVCPRARCAKFPGELGDSGPRLDIPKNRRRVDVGAHAPTDRPRQHDNDYWVYPCVGYTLCRVDVGVLWVYPPTERFRVVERIRDSSKPMHRANITRNQPKPSGDFG